MPFDIEAQNEKRLQIVNDARAILEKAEEEKRELTEEENANYKKAWNDQAVLKDQILRHTELNAVEAELRTPAGTPAQRPNPATAKTADAMLFNGKPMSRGMQHQNSPEYREQFTEYFCSGDKYLQAQMEKRAQVMDGQATQAGYLVLPVEPAQQLLKFVDDDVLIRSWATKFTVEKAEALGVTEFTTDVADADWTTELLVGNEETSAAFGGRELRPHPVAKWTNISRKLMRASFMDVQAFILKRLGYKLGVTQEKAFMTGSGAGQPLGLFTASSMGVPTSRDVSSGNTTTQVKFDGLIAAKFSFKQQYLKNLKGVFHRNVLEQISKEKDGDGNYIWRESILSSEPDRLLGIPVISSEFAPNTMTTGLYVGMFADFSFYWIVDALLMELQVLDQTKAKQNILEYILRAETDGQPMLAEAFARIKLA